MIEVRRKEAQRLYPASRTPRLVPARPPVPPKAMPTYRAAALKQGLVERETKLAASARLLFLLPRLISSVTICRSSLGQTLVVIAGRGAHR